MRAAIDIIDHCARNGFSCYVEPIHRPYTCSSLHRMARYSSSTAPLIWGGGSYADWQQTRSDPLYKHAIYTPGDYQHVLHQNKHRLDHRSVINLQPHGPEPSNAEKARLVYTWGSLRGHAFLTVPRDLVMHGLVQLLHPESKRLTRWWAPTQLYYRGNLQ